MPKQPGLGLFDGALIISEIFFRKAFDLVTTMKSYFKFLPNFHHCVFSIGVQVIPFCELFKEGFS